LLFFLYLALICAAAVLAILRLSESTAMPGLAAIELVILALPWSLALGIEPTSQLGWYAMVTIVFGGLGINASLIRLIGIFKAGGRPARARRAFF
jgi:hypothetical protein